MAEVNLEESKLLYEPQEPEYNRRNMAPLQLKLIDYNIDFTQLILSENFYNNGLAICIKFDHGVGVDAGGLAKDWFTKNYTSQAIIKFLFEMPYFDEIKTTGNIDKFNNCIKQILLLGYLNYRWLYISSDLLDVLYIFCKIKNEQIYLFSNSENFREENQNIDLTQDFNKLFDDIFVLFKVYLNNLLTNEFTNNFTINLNNVPNNIREIVKFMLKKVKNECTDNDKINFINRDHLIAYLYLIEFKNIVNSFINLENDNMETNALDEYYENYNRSPNNHDSVINDIVEFESQRNNEYDSNISDMEIDDNDEELSEEEIEENKIEAEYYLLRIIKTLYNKNKEQFTETLAHIDTNLNTNTLINFYNAIIETIPNSTNSIDDFNEENLMIYNTIKFLFPSAIEDVDGAFYENHIDGKPPDLFEDWNHLLLYGHLVNNNDIIDIEKIVSILNFIDNNLPFSVQEKQRFSEIIRSMTNDEAKNFIKFISGSDKVPNTINLSKINGPLSAHTCNNQIDIPVNLFASFQDNNTIKELLTSGLTDFNMAGGYIQSENNTNVSNIINSIFLGGIILLSSILQ